jgi:hypothetical protein
MFRPTNVGRNSVLPEDVFDRRWEHNVRRGRASPDWPYALTTVVCFTHSVKSIQGVCVCICLFGFMCRCAHAAIGRPFSTCEKGQKHPRLRLTSPLSTKKVDITRGGRGYNRTGGWGLTHTHTHSPRTMWEKIFPLAISLSSIKCLDECWVWTMASNTRRGWVRGKHSLIVYANHYIMNGYEMASWILNQILLLFHFHLLLFILLLSFRLIILHVTLLLY